MRILLTCDPELPVPPRHYGGIERMVDLLVRELAGRDHEVGLLAHQDSTSPAHYRATWPGAHSQKLLDSLRNLTSLSKVVQAFQPDVVHSFSRLLYLAPLLWRGFPCVMSYQRLPTARTVRWAHQLSRGKLQFTGCSEWISKVGREIAGTWTAIHNAVDPALYQFTNQVSTDAPLVFLSRIERIKGAHVAIQMARQAGKRLILAGNHASDGAEADYWQQEIVPHLGQNGIEYVGPVDDQQKNALLGNALAMLTPVQWDEPFGIVFAEALACGTPVISTPRGALPEIVRQGTDGYLVNSVDEGAQAILDVVKLSRKNCRERVLNHFTPSKITAQYEEVYHRAQSQSRA